MKTAIVTGAASGIGLAVMKKFLAEGYRVYGMSRREAAPITHENFHYIPGDISVAAHREKLVAAADKIDVLVNSECVEKGRRVFLDFTKNPFDIDFPKLSEEAYTYLNRAGATFGRPIDRLAKMNMPAIELYKNKGVDLSVDYPEIAICAQHPWHIPPRRLCAERGTGWLLAGGPVHCSAPRCVG